MYRAEKEQAEIDSSDIAICRIADNSGTIITVAANFKAAEEFAYLLNELSVERCHVAEIAEDIFYS